MKKKQITINKKIHNSYIKEILLILLIFYIPKLLNPSLPSTINILRTYVEIFWNLGVYSMIIKFLLNSVFVIVSVNFLINDDIKLTHKYDLSKIKRTFLYLFFGYFIYLFFLISILVQKSTNIQMLKGKDMIDIVYALCIFSFFLILIVIYLIRKEVPFSDTKIGSFILLLLGSAILFETFIAFSPLQAVFQICLNYEIIEIDNQIQFMVPYYFSIISGIILSIIDRRFFNYS